MITLTHTWAVGRRYRVEATIGTDDTGTVRMHGEWSPRVPARLKPAEITAYQRGRNALVARFGLVASEHQSDMVKLCEALKGVKSIYATRLFRHRSRQDRERILKSAYDVALVNFRDRAGHPLIPGPGVLPRGAVVVPRHQAIATYMASVRAGEDD